MNIWEEIGKVKAKYDLEIQGVLYKDAILNTVKSILGNLPNNKKIGIKGAGKHTQELLNLMSMDIQIVGIFDKDCREKEENCYENRCICIYPEEYIADMDIDIMIISSYAHRKAMLDELIQYQDKFQIIDIYDELRKHNMDINFAFYQPEEDMYENVLYYLEQYRKEENSVTLKNLIVSYLNIFDMLNYTKYSNEYIKQKYEDYESIELALSEIEKIFDCVRAKLKYRKNRDIIMFWNDQMGYDDLKKTCFMKEKSKQSFFMENAYAVAPFTHPEFLAMFQHLRSMDDNIYLTKLKISTKDNSDVLRVLDEHGYDFKYIGNYFNGHYFESKNVITRGTYCSSNYHMIALLQELLENQNPVFALVHICTETHNPYLSGELKHAKWYEWPEFSGDTEEMALQQMEESLIYWDRQLNYYTEFLHDGCVQIYMSDHGKRYNYQPVYKEPTMHIVFFVIGKNVPVRRISKMFSIFDLNKLISSILEEDYEEKKIFSDYVMMQETDIFTKSVVNYYVQNNAIEAGCGFRAVRTETELYVKLSVGINLYYLLPDENTNQYDNPNYKKRIAELDILAGNKFDNPKQYQDALQFYKKKYDGHE